jgi:hypothetical protein
MRKSFNPFAVATVAVTAMLAGCASAPALDAQWTDPAFAGRSYAGTPLLVACGGADVTAQRLCEDQVLAQMRTAGKTAVLARTVGGAPTAPGAEADAYLPAARSAGAAGLFYTRVASGYTGQARGGSSVGIGLGGFGGGRVGFGGGVGVSLPIGQPTPDIAWVANSSMVDVASGRTAWSASATGSPNENAETQLGSLAQRLVEGARKAGLL